MFEVQSEEVCSCFMVFNSGPNGTIRTHLIISAYDIRRGRRPPKTSVRTEVLQKPTNRFITLLMRSFLIKVKAHYLEINRGKILKKKKTLSN